MEDTKNNSFTRQRTTLESSRRRKRQRRQNPRIRSRKRCPDCGKEYSHSSFYTHKCGRTNDQEDKIFSLQFPTMSSGSSSDSDFYISSSDGEAPYNEAAFVESEPQLDELMQQSRNYSEADLQQPGTFNMSQGYYSYIANSYSIYRPFIWLYIAIRLSMHRQL